MRFCLKTLKCVQINDKNFRKLSNVYDFFILACYTDSGVIFVIMIFVYELFVTFRQFEMVLNKNGGKKNDRKSRK